jgi:hypothetical protein
MGNPPNRTRLIRDSSLATGKTCIACGKEANANIGDYAVCEQHRVTVSAPDPLQHWKRNVRNRHGRSAADDPLIDPSFQADSR